MKKWEHLTLLFILGVTLVLSYSCKVDSKGRQVKQSKIVEPKDVGENQVDSLDVEQRQDLKKELEEQGPPKVSRVELIYETLNQVQIPALSIDFITEKTYLKYKYCLAGETECVEDESYQSLHGILNLPHGKITVEYKPCYYRHSPDDPDYCGEEGEFSFTHEVSENLNPELKKALEEQQKEQQEMNQVAKKIHNIAIELKKCFDECQDKDFTDKFDSKQKKLIYQIAAMTLEELLKFLLEGGGLLEELLALEEERQEKEGERSKNIRYLGFNSIILAGSFVGMFNFVRDVAHWKIYKINQLKIMTSDDGNYFSLEKVNEKNNTVANGELLKIKNPKKGKNPCEDCRYIQDPYTKHIYQVSGSEKMGAMTGNALEVKFIEIPEGFKYQKGHLVSIGKSSKTYHIQRKDGFFELSDSKVSRAQINLPGQQSTPLEVIKSASILENFQNMGNSFKTTGSLGWKKISSRNFQKKLKENPGSGIPKKIGRGGLIMGAAATAGFIISLEALIKDSQVVTSSYGLATGTEDKCASIIKYLDELKREFDKATAIFQRLLQIKAKIVVLI